MSHRQCYEKRAIVEKENAALKAMNTELVQLLEVEKSRNSWDRSEQEWLELEQKLLELKEKLAAWEDRFGNDPDPITALKNENKELLGRLEKAELRIRLDTAWPEG